MPAQDDLEKEFIAKAGSQIGTFIANYILNITLGLRITISLDFDYEYGDETWKMYPPTYFDDNYGFTFAEYNKILSGEKLDYNTSIANKLNPSTGNINAEQSLSPSVAAQVAINSISKQKIKIGYNMLAKKESAEKIKKITGLNDAEVAIIENEYNELSKMAERMLSENSTLDEVIEATELPKSSVQEIKVIVMNKNKLAKKQITKETGLDSKEIDKIINVYNLKADQEAKKVEQEVLKKQQAEAEIKAKQEEELRIRQEAEAKRKADDDKKAQEKAAYDRIHYSTYSFGVQMVEGLEYDHETSDDYLFTGKSGDIIPYFIYEWEKHGIGSTQLALGFNLAYGYDIYGGNSYYDSYGYFNESGNDAYHRIMTNMVSSYNFSTIEKLNLYGKVDLGYDVNFSSEYGKTYHGFNYFVGLGTKIFFNDTFGIYGDVGYGRYIFKTGIVFKAR